MEINVGGDNIQCVALIDPVTKIPYSTIIGGGVDRELTVVTYIAKNAFTGVSVGDTITMTQIIDVSGTPSTVATIWRNQTTATDLAGAPLAANLEIVGGLRPVSNVLSLTLSLDTAVYADGDVLADTQELASASRSNDGVVEIRNLTVVDKDDQGQPFDIWVFSTNVSLGTENSVPSISDANAIQIFGKIEVSTIDFYDLGGVKVATPSFIPFLVKSGSSSQSIYVGAVSRGTGTYTASGIVLNFGIRQF